eukprot:Anaeramoba_ignava/c20676_g4_i4.p1 GENE.c20676_g4_i4~~c20676_g4_i4.p1  ORF type:complete len:273 (-),score=64.02 c20676_g4_i4:344-1162(-)
MINSVVNQRWKLVKSIGKGGYGEIFAAQDLHSDRKVAVKIENNKHKRQALKMEKTVLARFKNSPYAPDYIEFGKLADSHYLVMELLGSNFSNLRRNEPNGVFSLPTTLNLAIHMVGAIEDLHATGFIHRDIQPGNFAIRKPNHKESKCPHCVLFDYGLARRHLNEDKKPRRPRSRAGFRGTTKFASLQAHLSKEQSRRDDLWSLLFTLIEFLTRKLPWKNVKEKEKIIELKKEYSSEKLVATLPHEFASFIQHLNSSWIYPDFNYLCFNPIY